MANTHDARSWAFEMFGAAQLGDKRRTARLMNVARRAAENPAGRVSEVFDVEAERVGAYDFLESSAISPEAVLGGAVQATAEQCAREEFVFVPVDGSSLNLTDRAGEKDFGSIGTVEAGARGLKMINSIAVSPVGVPIGLLSQTWWARTTAKKRTRREKQRRNARRKTEEKETQRWLDDITQSARRLDEADATGWFQVDREGDAGPILLTLSKLSEHWFTVRSSWDRRLHFADGKPRYLRPYLSKAPVLGHYDLDVPAGARRQARTARMSMRAKSVVLRLQDKSSGKTTLLPITAVWVREVSAVPKGEKRLDWLLLTNYPAETAEDVVLVVFGYTVRWRVEDFHRTWKRGGCNVEDSQLRSKQAVVKWATVLATVAVRIERLKHLAREEPDKPADVELNQFEIQAILLLKKEHWRRGERRPTGMPTIGDAVRWIADLGGYTGKSSGGPPGAITIGRGFDKVLIVARALAALREEEG